RGNDRLGRGGGHGLAGTRHQLAALHLDHHLVGAAVAEGLLDLAGFNRSLEPQRPAAELRFVVAVRHLTSTSFIQNVVQAAAALLARRPLSFPVCSSRPRKRIRRCKGAATLWAAAESVSARWTTLSRPNATDSAARSSGKIVPCMPEPSASSPTRQAWSSLREPSSRASAA